MGREAERRAGASEVVVPVAEERLTVGTRPVDLGGVRVRKTVERREEPVEVPLARESIEVERVAVGRPVSSPPAPRYEGSTLVLPVVEERLVLEKRLVLVEEVRVVRRVDHVVHREAAMLRRERVEIEPISSPSAADERPQDGTSKRRRS